MSIGFAYDLAAMGTGLAALLIPPQEQRLWSRFGLGGTPLRLITSGWQKLIVLDPTTVLCEHDARLPAARDDLDAATREFS